MVKLEGIAIGQVTEGREHEVGAIAPDGADDVAGLAGRDLGASHQCEVAACRGAEQRLEVGAGVIGKYSSHTSLADPVCEPAARAHPLDRRAGGEVKDMGAAAEAVDDGV